MDISPAGDPTHSKLDGLPVLEESEELYYRPPTCFPEGKAHSSGSIMPLNQMPGEESGIDSHHSLEVEKTTIPSCNGIVNHSLIYHGEPLLPGLTTNP